jgi:hypothetical protein
LGELLALHAAPELAVLDASGGQRRLWTKPLLERWRPTFLDIDPSKKPDVVGDWNCLREYFGVASLGTIVWDPPHIADLGATSSIGYRERYAVHVPKGADAILEMYEPFIASAARVLHTGQGTIVVKLADAVRCGRLRLQPFWLWAEMHNAGWAMCDYEVRKRAQPPHNTTSTRRHIRRAETFWMVFHPTECCPGEGIAERRACWSCSTIFAVRRSDQFTCGRGRCRQPLSRARLRQERSAG